MKLILSERELEIIKQQEYKKGWYDCGVANEIHINNLKNYMNPPFEGEPEGFNKPSLATAEFRHEHDFLRNIPEPGTITEELTPVAKNEDGTISLGSGEYLIVNGEWYEVKKLQESCQHESNGDVIRGLQYANEPHYKCKKCDGVFHESEFNKSCQHESDGNFYVNEKMHNTIPTGVSLYELRDKGLRNKCKKCGEFY